MTQRLSLLLIVMSLALIGCGQTAQNPEDAAGSMEEAVTDAAKAVSDDSMEAVEGMEQLSDDLKAEAQELQSALKAKQAKLEELKAKLEGMAPEDLLSGDGKQLKADSELLTTEIATLKEKLHGLMNQEAAD